MEFAHFKDTVIEINLASFLKKSVLRCPESYLDSKTVE